MTILEGIQRAQSEADIQRFINLGNHEKPSGKTRRGWLTARRIRLEELKAVPAQQEPEHANS